MLFLKLIVILMLEIVILSQNSSDCVNMTRNKSTDQICNTSTDCCYFEYTYNGFSFKRCLKKLNISENICKNFSATVSYLGGSWIGCSCFAFFQNYFIFVSIISLFLI